MSSRHAIRLKLLEAVSGNSDGESRPVRISELDKASIHVKADGSLAFINNVNVSVRVNSGNTTSPWVQLDIDSNMSLSTSLPEFIIKLTELDFDELKLTYTNTTPGAGTFSAYFVAKTVGA